MLSYNHVRLLVEGWQAWRRLGPSAYSQKHPTFEQVTINPSNKALCRGLYLVARPDTYMRAACDAAPIGHKPSHADQRQRCSAKDLPQSPSFEFYIL